MILVINNNKDKELASYKERFLLFADEDKAVKYAEANGYENFFHTRPMKPGVKHVCQGGDIDISLINLEVII
jgi:hypothetical protein